MLAFRDDGNGGVQGLIERAGTHQGLAYGPLVVALHNGHVAAWRPHQVQHLLWGRASVKQVSCEDPVLVLVVHSAALLDESLKSVTASLHVTDHDDFLLVIEIHYIQGNLVEHEIPVVLVDVLRLGVGLVCRQLVKHPTNRVHTYVLPTPTEGVPQDDLIQVQVTTK